MPVQIVHDSTIVMTLQLLKLSLQAALLLCLQRPLLLDECLYICKINSFLPFYFRSGAHFSVLYILVIFITLM
jgi:hypothetical protein